MQISRPRSRAKTSKNRRAPTTSTSNPSFSTQLTATDASTPSTRVHPRKSSKGHSQSLKSTAQYDSLQKRHPLKKHPDTIPDVPFSSLPEDEQHLSYRAHIRKCTDTMIRVRQHNVEPYSYSHQIFAMHSVDPVNYGESAKQLIRPSRLVLDGPEGIEALAYYDQALTMPQELDSQVAELKSYSQFLLTSQTAPEPHATETDRPTSHINTNSGLKTMQKAQLPTSIHTNSLMIHTGRTQLDPSNNELDDVLLTKQRFSKHIEYAEVSSALKNIAYWGPESGSTDSVIGQHYAIPGMLVATTSQRTLGYVAAMGGISVKVSPAEAAGLLAGQPMYHFQSQNPVLVNLHGIASQWTAPQDVIAIIVQYLGELGFNSAFGLQQAVCVEMTDKGNQFSIDQLATICSAVGSLPNVASITVPSTASQLQFLRDTNRGVYNKFIFEYGPQLLEPDHQVKYTETVDIDLSKLTPTVSVHNSTAIHALNTVSCPLDYLETMTGENTANQLNLSKLTHIDNIAYHPAVYIESFQSQTGDDFFIANPKTGQRHRVIGNRYHYLQQSEAGEKMEARLGFDKYKDNVVIKQIHNMSKKLTDAETTQTPADKEAEERQKMEADQQKEMFKADAKRLTIDDVQIAPDVSTVGLTASTADPSHPSTPSPPPTSTTPHSTTTTATATPSKSSSKSLFSRSATPTTPSSAQSTPPATRAPSSSPSPTPPQQQSQAIFWPNKPNIILIRGGYNELKQSLKIWLQCLQEGMKPRVDTLFQPDTPQTLHLLKQAPDLCDEHGTNVLTLIEQFFPTQSPSFPSGPSSTTTLAPSTPSIRILAPGSGPIDYLLSEFMIKSESEGQIPSRSTAPTVLSTDLGLTQSHAGLNHYTPHLFTSSNEHSALTTFTGNLAFDPINQTLSPQHCKFHPEDNNSFFLLPSHGVEPEIDPETGKLKIPGHLAGSKYQVETLLSPKHTLPSNVMNTEFNLSRRIDLQFQIYNSRYKQANEINVLPTLNELESALNSPLDTNLETTLSSTHEYINKYIHKPTSLGYQTAATRLHTRNLDNATTVDLVNSIINPLSQSITHTYPAAWWNNDNIVDMPVLCHLNLPTSAADIAGLDQQLRFTPQQHQFVSKSGSQSTHLTNWLRAKLINSENHQITPATTTPGVTDINAPASTALDDADSAVLSDVLIRRLQATPRHLQYIFPFSNSQLHLRYALSGIKSSSPGSMSTLTKPEFISTTQPPSDGATSNASITSSTNSLGFGLGMKLNQLTSTRAQSRWTNFISPSKPSETIADSDLPSQPQSQAKPQPQTLPQQAGIDHLSNETNVLWAASPSSTASPSTTISNDFINHMMPSVRTFLKLPQGRTHNESKSPAAQLLLPHSQSLSGNMHFVQTLAWNYFVNGTKWALVGEGLSSKSHARIKASSRNTDWQVDNSYRWDQNGFGFGTPDECDQAVRGLKLLGCGAVLSPKINSNFLRALNNHGIAALNLSNPSDIDNINITDSVTIMTHKKESGDEGPESAISEREPSAPSITSEAQTKRQELFLPHTSPVLVKHQMGNRPTAKRVETHILETSAVYDAHSLLWFRAGNVVNAGVEQQLRTQLVDKALQFNGH